jgi:hypothetical protein
VPIALLSVDLFREVETLYPAGFAVDLEEHALAVEECHRGNNQMQQFVPSTT